MPQAFVAAGRRIGRQCVGEFFEHRNREAMNPAIQRPRRPPATDVPRCGAAMKMARLTFGKGSKRNIGSMRLICCGVSRL